MDADADDHSEEGIPFPCMDAHIMKVVIIEHPVIHPFTGSAVVINSLIFICSPGHWGIEADVPFRFGVDTPAIS